MIYLLENTRCNDSNFPLSMTNMDLAEEQVNKVLTELDVDRIIEMAWEDRTTFDAIKFQFGLNESQVKALMKSKLKFSSYKLWRKRVEACKTKHAKTRIQSINRFMSSLQRNISNNKISKRRTK